MNKNILLVLPVFILATPAIADFVIRIDDTNNEYVISNYTKTTTFTDWIDYEEPFDCTEDITESDVYYGYTALQTSICSKKQSRERTITKTYEDGTEEVTIETFYQTLTNQSIEETITGTHLENNCKDINDNGYSSGNGLYTLSNATLNFDAYCEMTIDGGGWTLLMTESNGINRWEQFSNEPTGTALSDDYRGSLLISDFNYTDILWYNHPTDEYSTFTQRTGTELTLSNAPTIENNTYVYYANGGERTSSDAYYNLIQCKEWADYANPILMLSGSDEYGSDNGGRSDFKSCGSWEGDDVSWYYRFAGGITSNYAGNPWKENGHTIRSSRLQSFYIR